MKARYRFRGEDLLTSTVDELLRDRFAADDGTRGRDRSFGRHVQIEVGERDEVKANGCWSEQANSNIGPRAESSL